ncbi:hypothetical protein GUJ93_ZPchr0007g4654 [Zizania palustris]|uniref:NAD-dependent epimerase/dehydratase domain-containing protein n=1 Tax=Zizania palustris TaxID=103762 RepID=A0A8J5TFK6_ZIZPA|nr:hypothetical protein GUJ93_ZPchr0007g4654 [Zizania palustris]
MQLSRILVEQLAGRGAARPARPPDLTLAWGQAGVSSSASVRSGSSPSTCFGWVIYVEERDRRGRASYPTMSRVCVTGASGYIATCLVKKLLQRGCVVHGTLRNLGDEKKAAPLRELPGAAERLVLFEADMYDADTFEPAIAGCEFVFLLATPLHHDTRSTKYKNTTEASLDATRIILEQCERSETVRRVIYTSSVTAAAPLREDGGGYKGFINESCWTPLDLSRGFVNRFLDVYAESKTLTEKKLLSYNESEKRAFEVVTLACAIVGGGADTTQQHHLLSIPMILAPLTGDDAYHSRLRFLQALLGSLPLAHIEDVCDAHIFCMEQPSIAGRFLCSAGYPNMQDFVDRFAAKFPELEMKLKQVEGEGVRVKADTSKLVDLGFKYKYSVEETLDGSVECAKKLGLL